MRLFTPPVLIMVTCLVGCAPAQQTHLQTASDPVSTLQADLTHSFPAEHPDLAVLRTELSHSLPADSASVLSAEMAYMLPGNAKARVVTNNASSIFEAATTIEPATNVLVTWGYTEPETDVVEPTDSSLDDDATPSPTEE